MVMLVMTNVVCIYIFDAYDGEFFANNFKYFQLLSKLKCEYISMNCNYIVPNSLY